MPIAYLRNKSYDLEMPHPMIGDDGDIAPSILMQHRLSEFIVYPPNYKGDMTPKYWKSLNNISRWTIEVDETGESAQIDIQNPTQYNPRPLRGIPGIVDPFDAASSPTSWRFPQVGYEEFFFVTHVPTDQRHTYIGGAVLYAAPDGVKFFQEHFPQVSP